MRIPNSYLVSSWNFSMWEAMFSLAVFFYMSLPASTVWTMRAHKWFLSCMGPDVSCKNPRLAEHTATEGASRCGDLFIT